MLGRGADHELLQGHRLEAEDVGVVALAVAEGAWLEEGALLRDAGRLTAPPVS